MGKKPLWKDILVLPGTGIAVVSLVILPPLPVLRWQGEVVFQIGKFAGILTGYILFLLGVWLTGKPQGHSSKQIQVLLQCSGILFLLAGLGLFCGFLLQNELQKHTELMVFGLFWLWPVLHGVLQYVLCRKGKSIVVRCIPVYICILELLYTVYLYFDPSYFFGGWDGLGALFTAVLTVPPSGAVLLAWLIWWVESAVRRRKQITE